MISPVRSIVAGRPPQSRPEYLRMPTYVYKCKECGHRFEIFQSFKADPLDACPECREVSLRKVLFPAGVVFKGSGFYVTDSRPSKPSTSGEKKEKSGEKKSDSAANGAASKKEPAKAGAKNDG